MNCLKLKAKLVEKGFTYEHCAKELNISTATFNAKMNEASVFKLTEIQKLSLLLELTEREKIDIFLG